MGMGMGRDLYSQLPEQARVPLPFPWWNSQAADPIRAVRRNCGMQNGEGRGVDGTEGDKILQSVGMLLQSQALSDLKIKTSDGKEFQAHKIILGGS
jgi:hypothetical protein